MPTTMMSVNELYEAMHLVEEITLNNKKVTALVAGCCGPSNIWVVFEDGTESKPLNPELRQFKVKFKRGLRRETSDGLPKD